MQLLGVSLQDDAPAGYTGGWLYNVLLLAAFPFLFNFPSFGMLSQGMLLRKSQLRMILRQKRKFSRTDCRDQWPQTQDQAGLPRYMPHLCCIFQGKSVKRQDILQTAYLEADIQERMRILFLPLLLFFLPSYFTSFSPLSTASHL